MRKKILIYGMGATGIELVEFCKKNKILYIPFDDTKKLINKSEKVLGPKDNFKNLLKYCNEIVVSPGIGLRNKNIQLAIKYRKTIISEIEFASRYITKPIVAITGTNGKTTVSTLLFSLFRELGYNVGLLSTVENKINDKVIPSTHTTPDAVGLNALLAQMVDEGCSHCFMEVSSHAIHQHRIAGLEFDGAVFTNMSHDHLDYHKTFKNYTIITPEH